MLPARDIVVRGTRIEQVAPTGGALPRGKTLIEGRGKFAIPGLIDAPVRLAAFSPSTLQRLLAAGITAVVDVGTDPVRARALAPGLERRASLRAANRPGLRDRPGPGRGGAAPVTRQSRGHPRRAGQARDIGRRHARAGVARRHARSGADALPRWARRDRRGRSRRPGRPHRPIRSTTSATPRAIDAVVFRGEVFTQAHVTQLRRGALPAPTPPR